jgi:hypothetical protein
VTTFRAIEYIVFVDGSLLESERFTTAARQSIRLRWKLASNSSSMADGRKRPSMRGRLTNVVCPVAMMRVCNTRQTNDTAMDTERVAMTVSGHA